MPIALPASSCPAPVAVASPTWVSSQTSPTGVPPTSAAYGQGVVNAPSSSTLNGNATRYDNATRYGCGGYAIGYGLALSAGSGIQVACSDGHAIIDGLIEIRSAAAITCADNASRWIWLKQDKTFVVQATTAKPSGNCIFLGKVTCAGGVVTGIDTSGVVYWKAGRLWRQTADTEAPTDSPSADLRIETLTAKGTYYWNGTSHISLGDTDLTPRWRKYTFSYSDLSTAALTVAKNLALMPAGAVVHAVKIRVTQAFAGTGIATLVFDVGITGTTTKYITAHNGLATGQAFSGTQSMESSSGTIQGLLTATATGANLNQLTQGSVDVWVMYSVAI